MQTYINLSFSALVLQIIVHTHRIQGDNYPDIIKDKKCLGSQFWVKNVQKHNSLNHPCFYLIKYML